MDLSIRRLVVTVVACLLVPPGPTVAPARAQPGPAVDCRACLLVDDLNQELFARAPDRRLPNASTTKMLTALVTVERVPSLDDEVTVSPRAAATPEGKLSLQAGERLSVRELLAALLLNSSNDAAVALAEHVAGSESAFVNALNERAAQLGAVRTHFVTPHGLDRPGHVSTARDLAIMAQALLADEVLASIVAAPRATITSSARRIELTNTNELIAAYPGATGVKTGFTLDAGNVLVASAKRHGRTLLAVVMGSDDHFADSIALLDHGFERLSRGILLADMTTFTDLVLDPGGSTGTAAASAVRGINHPDRVTVEFFPEPDLTAPIEVGDRVGTAVVYDLGGREVGRSRVLATTSVPGHRPGWLEGTLSSVISVAARALPGEW